MKGKLQEAISEARFTEGDFYVQYRDFGQLVHLPIAEFWKIAQIVPEHRIARVIRECPGETRHSEDGMIPTYESSDRKLLSLPIVYKDEADEATLLYIEKHLLQPKD